MINDDQVAEVFKLQPKASIIAKFLSRKLNQLKTWKIIRSSKLIIKIKVNETSNYSLN